MTQLSDFYIELHNEDANKFNIVQNLIVWQ